MSGAVLSSRARSGKAGVFLPAYPNGIMNSIERSEHAHGGEVACFWIFLKWVIRHCDGCCSEIAFHFNGVDIFLDSRISDNRDARLVDPFSGKG